jgi:ATP-binding cassette, subfamily B, bacterial MsbA
MKEYLKLLKFLKPYSFVFFIASVFMGLSAIFDGMSLGMIVPLSDKVLTDKKIILPAKLPAFLENLITQINAMPPFELLKIMAFVVLAVIFLKGVVTYFQGYIMSDIGQCVMRDVRLQLYRKFLNFSLDFYARKKGGELISRITNDVRLVENAVSYGLTDLIYQTLQVVLFTIVIFFINWKLALIVFFVLPLLTFPIVNVGKKLRKLSKASQERMADINSSISETIFGIRIIKGFSMEGYESNKFQRINWDYYKLMMKSIKRTLLLSPATEFVGAMAGIFVFYYGGKEVIAGRMSFGVFGLFLGSLLSLVRPFKKLSSVNSIIQQALAANTRIYEVLDEKVLISDESNEQLNPLSGEIVFEDVYFKYENTDVLSGINLKVKKEQIVAIVGPSGAGKSTL